MRRTHILALVALTAAALTTSSATADQRDANALHETLSGYQEDPGAVSTTGTGTFHVKIDESAREIHYELSYSSLAAGITQSHIHFGGKAQSGGISVFLCTNLGNGPAGTQVCPAAPATITGVIRPVDVIGPNTQGIAPGEFDELVAAVNAGTTYVNVHTTQFPGGEIRAQLGHSH
ncbi:CHRD domain-containing protein [Actinokineospora sp. HUAS TT18]|uniref:CHRD domain-containing protein n=1 Tax=Actinokineospora sp. HUAS TT18 TaxID=3447451 RepID=UPI003F51CE8C